MTIPTVSILMPIYKTAPYLKEAVDSILAQTYTDFELIALNDCSPDNAEEILDLYYDPRIVRYRGEQNVGLANVLNTGMAMARGQFIARMDSDDISLPQRLEIQMQYLEQHPEIDLCSCGMELFGERSEIWVRESNPNKVKITALFFSPVLHASSVWRKESFERNNLTFRQETVPAEDYDLWTRALLKGLQLSNIPDVLYLYRIRPGQATATANPLEQLVRENYIAASLPSLTTKQVKHFPKSIVAILIANLKHKTFKTKTLTKRLIKLWLQKSKNRQKRFIP